MTPLIRSLVVAACLGSLGCAAVGSVTAPRQSKQEQARVAREAAVKFEQNNELWKDPLLEVAPVEAIVRTCA